MRFFHEQHAEPRVLHNQKIRFAAHLHYEVEIITLFKGCTDLTVNGRDYHMEQGDFLLVFPNTVHSYTTQENVDVGKFIFSTDMVPELKDVFKNKFPKSPVIPRAAVLDTDIPKLAEEILRVYACSSPIVKKAYLLLLAGKLLERCPLEERKNTDHDLLNRVFSYCQTHYRDPLTQKQVAEALHISESYLSHLFSAKSEMNFCSYLNMLRLNDACARLVQSDESITCIAQECGFASLRTFNRAFLKHIGTSPRDYRKNISEADIPN